MKTKEYHNLNLNDNILVKITDDGYDLMVRFYQQFALIPNYIIYDAQHYKDNVDENGYTNFTFWQFIEIFGEKFHMGVIEKYININLLVEK